MKKCLITALLVVGTIPTIANNNVIFPKHEISIGFYNHKTFPFSFPKLPKPLFWNSRFRADNGIFFLYEYTRYHTQKHFSVNLGISSACWGSGSENLVTLSGLFELRLWLFRTKTVNPYLFYSFAGPTFISQTRFAGSKLGGVFLFQDYLGAGVLLGKKTHINIEVRLIHYSNGDLAKYNKGLQIPFVLSLGLSFY